MLQPLHHFTCGSCCKRVWLIRFLALVVIMMDRLVVGCPVLVLTPNRPARVGCCAIPGILERMRAKYTGKFEA